MFCVACRAAPEHAPSTPAPLADQSAELAARGAERRATELQQLIAIDRQSLELAERAARSTRSLYDAGRVTRGDLQQAETQLELCREQLAQHSHELEQLGIRR
ncbi:MAG: TolC family protein [Planctomycetes bacterium]|nr:TolC family protein [Planctomycetota bacterium]